ncbi:WavE lipopolysaccharide synthesis family protein [uncultured Clostridium sp.]|uniref:WavE lipopolysaccharide synthesis family protein n=1 Tax=uncultured Clostridium sp. TaxID=59620 RepID=UPI0025DA86B1|nr:WavE lipopolysaccharide synthesis family protein [uncultured Clostridium sp.]
MGVSEDPGALIIDDVSGTFNNINRQIISTKSGLKYATRKYILKTRTDIVWNDSGILKYFELYAKDKSTHFHNRILVCNYYTRNPRVLPLPFHISDWLAFGINEDINLYYDCNTESLEDMRWFKNRKKKQQRFYTNLLTKYVPEQYICLNFATKFYKIDFSCFYDASKSNIKLTEEILANDFVVLDYKAQININFPKYNPNRYLEKFTLISNKQWNQLYREYCKNENGIDYYFKIIINKLFYLLLILRLKILVVLHRLRLKEKVKRLLERYNFNK